jgi:SAM-dependent methyltransferase
MNKWVLRFCGQHAALFKGGTLLEVGSRNVNGTVRDALPVTWGIDIQAGPGVDEVLNAEELANKYSWDHWDGVVSCDAIEHMADWRAALTAMWGVLRDDGYMILTTVQPGFKYHPHPIDAWRFRIQDMEQIFGSNLVELQTGKTFAKDAGQNYAIGVLAQKRAPLFDLSRIDLPVPTKP